MRTALKLLSADGGREQNSGTIVPISAKYQMIRDFGSPGGEKWRVCIPDPFENCEKICPIQQSKVRKIIDDLKNDQNIKKIIIFGSSTRKDCHAGSDVDLYVELEDDKKVNIRCTEFAYDLWTNYSVDDRMLKEIQGKGVTVYAK